jgi:hypothetical protein
VETTIEVWRAFLSTHRNLTLHRLDLFQKGRIGSGYAREALDLIPENWIVFG